MVKFNLNPKIKYPSSIQNVNIEQYLELILAKIIKWI